MDIKATALLLALLTIASIAVVWHQEQASPKHQFQAWRQKYGLMKDLSADEVTYRIGVFNENLRLINEHNILPGRSYDMGVNQFTGLTQEEFEKQFLTPTQAPIMVEPLEEIRKVSLQPIDWVANGAVTSVKNQGSCTATYAFASIGAVQAASFILTRSLVEYSVQQVIDCSYPYGNFGCNNGTFVNTFGYLRSNGIDTWSQYPYTGRVASCYSSGRGPKISGWTLPNSCLTLQNNLYSRPIAVAVDGSNFNTYRSGIFSNCGQVNIGLAVLLVGMTDDYYKLKSSFGTTWGEFGYIRIKNAYNTCGICTYPAYPVL